MKRNVRNINLLADEIESRKYRFCIYSGGVPKCGIAGCIGGHAAALWKDVRADGYPYFFAVSFDTEKLAKKLGVSRIQAWNLCYAPEMRWFRIDRDMAVATVRRLAKTGRTKFTLRDSGEMG